MRMKRLAGALAAAAIAVALAGCGADVTPAPTGTGSPSDVTDITDQPGSVEGYVGALEDAETTRCERDGSNWIASGTVTNPLDEVQSYRLYVSAMDGSDTRGVVQVDVPEVAGGDSAEWTAEFPLPDDDLTCVLRVERFAP